MLITVVLFWAVMWSITSDESLPGGNYFALIILFVCCILGGMLAEAIRLPPLLGKQVLVNVTFPT